MKKHFNKDNTKNCTKCHKCVKSCPSEAITFNDGVIFENEKLCIDCGVCSRVCSKDIHTCITDVNKIEKIITSNKIVALLDTTYFLDAKATHMNQIVESLIALGFDYVDSTFDGWAIRERLCKDYFQKTKKQVLNGNCLPVYTYIQKFHHKLTSNILPYMQSSEISAVLKKEQYPDDVKIMLVTNCFGDYGLSESNHIDYVVLKSEIEELLDNKNIIAEKVPPIEQKSKAFSGTYLTSFEFTEIDGFPHCEEALNYLTNNPIEANTPLRFFACEKGCINSGAIRDTYTLFERQQRYLKFLSNNFDFDNTESIDEFMLSTEKFAKNYPPIFINYAIHSKDSIASVLQSLRIDDYASYTDCNICGYDTCEKFATAILDNRANPKQCQPYLTMINEEQSKNMSRMLEELNEAFSLTIPDNRLEKKLKTTPMYTGIYDTATDYFEVTKVIPDGLYSHIINSLKLASDLKYCNVFALIGVDKNILVQAILYHCNAKTQPMLCEGDVVRYSEVFENKKEEALRSSTFASHYYDINNDVCELIKYQHHEEADLDKDFPKCLLPVYRLFRILDLTASHITKTQEFFNIDFAFEDFILYITIQDSLDTVEKKYQVDLYREQNFGKYEQFLKG